MQVRILREICPGSCRILAGGRPEATEIGAAKCAWSLSTYGSRGDVEPIAALAVALKALGVEGREGAPPDFEDLLARVGVPLVPAGSSVRGARAGARGAGLFVQRWAQALTMRRNLIR